MQQTTNGKRTQAYVTHVVLVVLVLCISVDASQGAGAGSDQKRAWQEMPLPALEERVAAGDLAATHELARRYFGGRGDVRQSYEQAARLWREIVEAGGLPTDYYMGRMCAHSNLGYVSYYGKGINQDRAEGVRLWRIAAEQGYPEAQLHLGVAYSDGKLLERDPVEAYAWLATSAENVARGPEVPEFTRMEADARERADGLLEKMDVAVAEEAALRAQHYLRKYPWRRGSDDE